jgi:putative transposase
MRANNNVAFVCKYHVVWCPKYRRKVLIEGAEKRLQQIIREVAEECGALIIEMEIMPDHVHLLVDVDPQFARKTKFSANWQKQKAKIGRLHTRAANARKNFLHQQSTIIAKSHGVIKIDKLVVRNMTASAKGTIEAPGSKVAQKSGLNRAIVDQGWGMFASMLKYKAAERGGDLIEVPAPYTSQTCSCCGVIDIASRKDQATFECVGCGYQDNADVNAAKNILQARTMAAEPPKRTLGRVGKRKQPVGAIHAGV